MFGLSSKILIVDEVHEVGDPYIVELLATLLRAHRQAGGSAILLTATLPTSMRSRLIEAWGESPPDSVAYPLLTVTGRAPQAVRPLTDLRGPVEVRRLVSADEAVSLLARSARQGAACVWVRNAVDDAIAGVKALRQAGVEADLLHARFALTDRLRHQAGVLERFGKARQGGRRPGPGGHAGGGILTGSRFRHDGLGSCADCSPDSESRATVAAYGSAARKRAADLLPDATCSVTGSGRVG